MSPPTPIVSPDSDKGKGFAAEHLEHVVSYDDAEKQQPHVIGDLKEVDEAAKVMAEAGKIEYTLEEDKAVLRKIDTWILPVL
jgi:hypothetical protein